jgi:hypothetical protein
MDPAHSGFGQALLGNERASGRVLEEAATAPRSVLCQFLLGTLRDKPALLAKRNRAEAGVVKSLTAADGPALMHSFQAVAAQSARMFVAVTGPMTPVVTQGYLVIYAGIAASRWMLLLASWARRGSAW